MAQKNIFAFLTSLLAMALVTTQAFGHRALPDDNLAYPVLVELEGGGTGSAFYLNHDEGIYLVTAAHVFFDPSGSVRTGKAKLISYPGDQTKQGRFVLTLQLDRLALNGHLLRHQRHDVAVVFIARRDASKQLSQVGDGVEVVEIAKDASLLGVNLENTKVLKDVLVGNDIYLFGYPTSLGLRQTPQLDPERPLLRKGIIAGKNLSNETLIVDAPAYFGNSGGPVLEVEETNLGEYRYRIVGVVTQLVPFEEQWENRTQHYINTTRTNSGYSIAVPMDPILELVSQCQQ